MQKYIIILLLLIVVSCNDKSKEIKENNELNDFELLDSIAVYKSPNVVVISPNYSNVFAHQYDSKTYNLINCWIVNDKEKPYYVLLYKYGKYVYHVVNVENGHWGSFKVYDKVGNYFVELNDEFIPKLPEIRIEIEENGDMKYVSDKEVFLGDKINRSIIDSLFKVELERPFYDTISGIGDTIHYIKLKN